MEKKVKSNRFCVNKLQIEINKYIYVYYLRALVACDLSKQAEV